MAKLDQVKETLNNHRLALTILVGLELVLVGGVVSSYRANVIDLFFWLGLDLALMIPLLIVFVSHRLMRDTRTLGEL
jgi:hypothetical protein